VPAASPKPARPKPPDTNTVVANPTITRFINLGFSPSAALCVLGIRVNPKVRFMLAPWLLWGVVSPCGKRTLPALLPIPTFRAEPEPGHA
jgi:hypothetical protein